MRRAARWLVYPAGVFLILCLVLSIAEEDNYHPGSTTAGQAAEVQAVDGTLHLLAPDPFVHPCTVCGECTHPVEILESRRSLGLRDRDGWYKLFWAADERYSYEDPMAFAAALSNRTARDPEGTWTIRARLGPATHGPVAAHDCGQIPAEIRFTYGLLISPDPIATEPVSLGEFRALRRLPWMIYRYDTSRLAGLLHFGWWAPDGQSIRADLGPCACGKP